MKQIILGDTHGKNLWKKIVDQHPDFDRLIFIGDYFDTHERETPEEQLNNFLDICTFSRSERGKREVITLIGNHDYHYWPGVMENYSGYQPHMRAAFEKALDQNKDILMVCFEDEYGTLYSHAGVTKTFLKRMEVEAPYIHYHDGNDHKVDLNTLFKQDSNKFSFWPFDRSDCGDDPHQSCIWVRPESLYYDKIDQLQVVGHTRQDKITHPEKSERRAFYLIDCLAHGQYLIRGDEKFSIGYI